MHKAQLSTGHPYPLGATFDGEGVNFAIFSQNATRVTLCLCDEKGREIRQIDLVEKDGFIWHGYLSGLQPGQQYGYRIHGPYEPEAGHRFNPYKFLIDPYSKRLNGQIKWNNALYGYKIGKKTKDLGFDRRDSAKYMPRSVVVDPAFSWGRQEVDRINRSWSDTVIYEAHVKGLTAGRKDVPHAGRFMGMTSEPILNHLTKLGVTAIELLPVQAFVDDHFLVKKGLKNYWGYMTYGFFAPEPRFMSYGEIGEFQQMVARFHSAGIEVILDVVYNHTAEGDQNGPTLCFRGIDNASYYRLQENHRFYNNDSGCGNTLNLDHPFVLRMVMDSLRYWVEIMHVDGFRFDLATTLGRTSGEFDRNGPFMTAIRQDPVLNKVKLIAEPWDIGPGGYQLGAYPSPFVEWNDKYRDQVRRFWRGDAEITARKVAQRAVGSALRFDHDGRHANSSINFLACHDGLTLMDTVSYKEKHNYENGEDNQDGHNQNFSDNCGIEGPTDDLNIQNTRLRRRKNMLATLLFSQGTPMILAGDELGNSQNGNNNAYCQDNPIGWVNWNAIDKDFLNFCQKIISFRKKNPILRQKLFLHAQLNDSDGTPDLRWRKIDGTELSKEDWYSPHLNLIGIEMRMAKGTSSDEPGSSALYLVFNRGDDTKIILPDAPEETQWFREFDTGDTKINPDEEGKELIFAHTVVVFKLSTKKKSS